jgi:uncharacterized protein YwgA
MSNFETMVGVLELVKAAGNLDSRIRVQKEAYLLATLGVGRFKASTFAYHHYGPYSRDVSDALQTAVSLGLVIETRTDGEDGSYVRYSYGISDEGHEFLNEAESNVSEIVPRAEAWGKSHWRALELAATVRFLELNEGFKERDKAISEALKLKPATAKYLNDAEVVLGGL